MARGSMFQNEKSMFMFQGETPRGILGKLLESIRCNVLCPSGWFQRETLTAVGLGHFEQGGAAGGCL
jgi:hypothetical protein